MVRPGSLADLGVSPRPATQECGMSETCPDFVDLVFWSVKEPVSSPQSSYEDLMSRCVQSAS